MTLSYNRNYNLADHRRIAISAETLDRIVVMLKQGYSNRDIADTLGISVESVYQVRIAVLTVLQVTLTMILRN